MNKKITILTLMLFIAFSFLSIKTARADPATNWSEIMTVIGAVDLTEFSGLIATGTFEANMPEDPIVADAVDLTFTVGIDNQGVDGIIDPGIWYFSVEAVGNGPLRTVDVTSFIAVGLGGTINLTDENLNFYSTPGSQMKYTEQQITKLIPPGDNASAFWWPKDETQQTFDAGMAIINEIDARYSHSFTMTLGANFTQGNVLADNIYYGAGYYPVPEIPPIAMQLIALILGSGYGWLKIRFRK